MLREPFTQVCSLHKQRTSRTHPERARLRPGFCAFIYADGNPDESEHPSLPPPRWSSFSQRGSFIKLLSVCRWIATSGSPKQHFTQLFPRDIWLDHSFSAALIFSEFGGIEISLTSPKFRNFSGFHRSTITPAHGSDRGTSESQPRV